MKYFKQYDLTNFKDCVASTIDQDYVVICAGHRDEEADLAEKFKNYFPSFEKILSNSLFV